MTPGLDAIQWMLPLVGAAIGIAFVLIIVIALCFRVVVPTNDVFIVQRARKTVSYGRGETAGNVFYWWPSKLPVLGVRVTTLPITNFMLQLNEYEAYDRDRVPFVIDVSAFFRIFDSGEAAQRISSKAELDTQLDYVLRGAMRSILAKSEIQQILEGRAEFGEQFTKAVDEQLKEWGVKSVKNVELMDIRDAKGSAVIANIMAKKKSEIERDSRVTVAQNMRTAQVAEVDAKQAVEVRLREQQQAIGQREAERDREIGIAKQQAEQSIQEQAAITAQKTMAVLQVNTVRQAEITREAQLVAAEQKKQVLIIEAEATKTQTITVAEGQLEQAKREAQATETKGRAEGEAQTAVAMAPVRAQIALAEKIGSDSGYQQYLVTIEQIKAGQAVGIEMARSLTRADVKVIANSGTNVGEGLNSVADLFSTKTAGVIAGMIETVKSATKSAVNGATDRPSS